MDYKNLSKIADSKIFDADSVIEGRKLKDLFLKSPEFKKQYEEISTELESRSGSLTEPVTITKEIKNRRFCFRSGFRVE